MSQTSPVYFFDFDHRMSGQGSFSRHSVSKIILVAPFDSKTQVVTCNKF